MQKKPQLSAEIGEKFYTSFGSLIVDDNGKFITKEIEAFLATALEEQRAKVIEEMEGWLVEYRKTAYVDELDLIDELRAKLEEMKGEL